jgi:hypothetical protein
MRVDRSQLVWENAPSRMLAFRVVMNWTTGSSSPAARSWSALFLRAQRLVPNRGAEDLLCRGGELA